MSAVAAPPGDTLVSQPRRERTFAARRSELTLVMKPEYPRYGPSGEQVGMKEGTRIAFQDGMLRLPLEGNVTTAQGRSIPATEVLEFLDGHRLNGDQHEGFFEIAQAAPPVSEEELEAITGRAILHDTDGLQAILESERAGWNRSSIVRAVEKNLAAIQQIAESLAAEAARESRTRK